MTDWALELAENPNTYVPLRPGHERVVTDRYVLWLGGGDQPGLNVAQRFRFRDEELDEVRAEIHEHVRAHGRTVCSWEVGSSATPTGLVERLLALGLEYDDEPLRVGMALTAAPPEVPEVEVRRAETVDEPRLAARIAATVFATPYVEPAPPDSGSHLSRLRRRAAGRATGSFSEHAVTLFGGAVLQEARAAAPTARSSVRAGTTPSRGARLWPSRMPAAGRARSSRGSASARSARSAR